MTVYRPTPYPPSILVYIIINLNRLILPRLMRNSRRLSNLQLRHIIVMYSGGLNDILKALLDSNNETISHQELIRLLNKIENDATEICHDKYGLGDKITFNIDHISNSESYPLGRQDVRSIECIRQSIRKNLDLMSENLKATFQSYLI